MKFLIITDYMQYTVEADDIEEAVVSTYHNGGYCNIVGVIRLPEEE